MKKLFLVLFLIFAATVGFQSRGHVLDSDLLFNKDFNSKTVAPFWREIRQQDTLLPLSTPITLYLNSNGGDAQLTTILLERIKLLQSRGRVFHGVIYGYCYSACGSLFAIMDKRYMTRNAVFMQHKSHGMPGPTYDVIRSFIDDYRLLGDARLLGVTVKNLKLMFRYSDYVINAKTMLKERAIHGIVDQPDIAEL